MERALVRRYRFVIGGIAAFVAAHLVGMMTMAALLRPGMDAASFSLDERMRYVAEHPWAWRLGWLPWQLSALSDVWLCVALGAWMRARQAGRGARWMVVALGLALASAIPEQWAEAMLVGPFVASAQTDATASWGAQWDFYLRVTGVWAGTGYVLMTGAWMMAIRRATGRGAWPAWLEVALLLGLAAGSALLWVATESRTPEPWFAAAGVASAVGFPAVIAWTLGAAVRLGEAQRRELPDRSDPGFALRWPENRTLRWLAPLATDGVRDVLRLASRALPYPKLRSDVTDVVYLTWMVPIERVRPLVPDELPLHDFEGRTPLSILTYRHGGFGPAVLGPLRRAMPSPGQSNWRLYIAPRGRGTHPDTVFFLKNVIDHPLYVAGSRALSDGLPGHLPASFVHHRDGRELHTVITRGSGSAPDLEARVRESEDRTLPHGFEALGSRWEDVVQYLLPQDCAVRTHRAVGLRSESRIALDVGAGPIRPAAVVGQISSDWLAPMVEGCRPLAFVVPALRFESTGERWEAL